LTRIDIISAGRANAKACQQGGTPMAGREQRSATMVTGDVMKGLIPGLPSLNVKLV
jgi:hypothetical protein